MSHASGPTVPAQSPARVRPRIHRAWALVVALVFFILAGALVAADGLVDRSGIGEIVIVPGNTVSPDGTPSPRLASRLDAALEVYRGGGARWIFVSGGIEPNGWNEARVMRDYVVARGIPARAVVEDSLGANTWSTAEAASRFMRAHGLKRAVIATQFFHVTRTRLALRRCGVCPVYSRHARFKEWRDLYSLAREVPAVVEYQVRPL